MGVAVVGSGLTFHNMAALRGRAAVQADNAAFETWLRQTLEVGTELDPEQRCARLEAWARGPGALACHPKGQEEHLMPLLVCLGAAGGKPARNAWHFSMMGWQASHFAW